MSSHLPVPETKVLAIASHVIKVVYGFVGNTMATLVMQSLGCEVSALNTVHFSNHTGYKHVKGTKASAEDIEDIYEGLKQNYLTDFDVLLSGYAPGAEAVSAVGHIARDLKFNSSIKPGSFFWVLDPVMGDEGKLYVNEDVVPVYKSLLHDADLILPNQFEAELLSECKITSLASLKDAITKLHKSHQLPHVVVTSVRFPQLDPTSNSTLSVIGSSRRTDGTPRMFKIDVPDIDCFFSGTGDMFAALMVVRLREASTAANLNTVRSWLPDDSVEAVNLPLARAVEKVLASMHLILEKTMAARDEELKSLGPTLEMEESSTKRLHLRKTKAAEIRLVRNLDDLKAPDINYKAEALGE